MKSICIKLTSQKTAKCLLEHLNSIEINDVYFSCKKFRVYNNIIIHYKGENHELFLKKLSILVSNFIISLFEENIINILINSEYFYFDDTEKQHI